MHWSSCLRLPIEWFELVIACVIIVPKFHAFEFTVQHAPYFELTLLRQLHCFTVSGLQMYAGSRYLLPQPQVRFLSLMEQNFALLLWLPLLRYLPSQKTGSGIWIHHCYASAQRVSHLVVFHRPPSKATHQWLQSERLTGFSFDFKYW